MTLVNSKKRFIITISLLLTGGFLVTSFLSYFISLSTLRNEIISSSLPLTSDNVYSEIQRDIVRPIFIASLMANDTFLRDWILNGERNPSNITKYLKEISLKYHTFTSFLVSDKSKIYYHTSGILKKVDAEEWRDVWYFRVQRMQEEYEINVDPDLANADSMTIFINHRVFDYDGNYIGATGIGMTVKSLTDLMKLYGEKYNRDIFLVDRSGNIMLHNLQENENPQNLYADLNNAALVDDILQQDAAALKYTVNHKTVHVNSRFIPELEWVLIVEQVEEDSTRTITQTLMVNLILCGLITIIIIFITIVVLDNYQKVNLAQQKEIVVQHNKVQQKNKELQAALNDVKTLSGLLPICASCKKIRDDQGYWQQLEHYISEHSNAGFSHSICPDCAQKYYNAYLDDEGEDDPSA